jgi:Ca-activated chloride channel family protein
VKLILALVLAFQATLTVRTVLVALPVTVTDVRGDRVTGLTADRFRIYADGVLQPVTQFHHGAGPITLGLVVDHSTSMRDNLPGVTAALSAFAAVTHPDDQLFAIDFNERVSRPLAAPGTPFTSDARAIAAVVGSIPARGQTALYDAIIAGLDQAAAGRWDKRTLIVVSDGGDNASRHTHEDVQALALRSDVVIYAIGLRGTSDERSPRLLERLARDSGGVAYFPETRDVGKVLGDIVRDLREQYTLGFSPDSVEGGVHQVAVTAFTPAGRPLRVRTRAAYLGPEDLPR